MKVIRQGVLVFSCGHVNLSHWGFETDEEIDASDESDKMKMLACAVEYLAERHSISVNASLFRRAPGAEGKSTMDVERLTQDVIAVARWRPQE